MKLKALSLEELMQVKVTVGRTEKTIAQTPSAVFLITPEMIRRSGATSIAELLRMVPGVTMAKSNANNWTIGIRGLDPNKLLVQVDGRTVYNPITSGVFWNTVDYPLEDIERIEVVRGPGGSVWGANAVNGVINIITKSAKDTHGGLVTGGGGSEEQGFASFRWGGQIGDNLHYRVYGKWFERDDGFNMFGNAHDDWRSGRAGFQLDWVPNPDDTLTLQSEWFATVAGSPTAAPIAGDTENRGAHAIARWTRDLGEKASIQIQAYYDRFDQRQRLTDFRFTYDTYDVDFQHQFPIGDRQHFIYGAGYRLQKVTLDGVFLGTTFIGPEYLNVDRHTFSAFLQDEIELVDEHLWLTLGSKFEHNDFTGFEYQPTARLLWAPNKQHSIWAAVSRAVRTPHIFEDTIIITGLPTASPALTQSLLPNNEMDSEELIAYELGYRTQPVEQLSFDAALFYHDYDRLSVITSGLTVAGPTPGTFVIPLQFTNGMDGDTYGAEFSATWDPIDWWQITGSYTYVKIDLHADQKLPLALRSSQEVAERQTAQNRFYIRSSFDIPGNVEFDLIGRYVDTLPAFPLVEGYMAVDARLAWKPRPNIEVAVVGQNLFDNHRPETGANALTLVEVERSVYGVIKWEF